MSDAVLSDGPSQNCHHRLWVQYGAVRQTGSFPPPCVPRLGCFAREQVFLTEAQFTQNRMHPSSVNTRSSRLGTVLGSQLSRHVGAQHGVSAPLC